MKIIRLQQKRFSILFFVIFVFIIISLLWSSTNEEVSDCFLSKKDLQKIENLLLSIQKPLNDLKLSYFLCYDSLWGALKMKGPLPWRNSLELCVLNKELSALDEGFLIRTFKRHHLSIVYHPVGGFYKVTALEEMTTSATLTVFEEDTITQQMRRVGVMHRMLPPNACDELNCFPPELIAQPLPLTQFGELNIPAPRDGIEIQKYLFPNSWWKELTPVNCRKTVE